MWQDDALVEHAAAALQRRRDDLAAEQAVRGIDALAETGLHPLLREGFAAAGYGAWAEHPYPGEATKRPRRAERERCDLVLALPGAGDRLVDPVERLKAIDAGATTLFSGVATELVDAGGGIAPEDAYWIEVKTIGQFTFTHGVPGPNRAYATELVHGPIGDLVKLEWDRSIRQGASLVVLFTADQPTAEHDLAILSHRCLDRELPIGSPLRRDFAIPDLIGNAWCTVALIPIRSRA